MKSSSYGKYERVNSSEKECETVPINLSTFQNVHHSQISNHHVVKKFHVDTKNANYLPTSFSFDDELDEEMKMKEKSTIFHVSSFVAIFAAVVVLLVTLSMHYSNMVNEAESLKLKSRKLEPMSIYVDYETNEYKVVDNYPLLNPSVAFNTKIGNENLQEHVLAYGTYLVNVNGNGWDYMSAETVNLADYTIEDSVPKGYVPLSGSDDPSVRRITETKQTNVDSAAHASHHKQVVTEKDFDNLVAQQYFRTMEAIGFLEGFATCVTMNEWYVNFYSGLFDGGNPTDESMEFLLENHDWMVSNANSQWQTSDYWRTIRGMLSQITGIVNGANAGCPGSENDFETRERGVELSSLTKQHSIIHMLLINSNGDMYQIADKFLQFNAPPSDILEDIPNDDGYFFELTKNSTAANPYRPVSNKPPTPPPAKGHPEKPGGGNRESGRQRADREKTEKAAREASRDRYGSHKTAHDPSDHESSHHVRSHRYKREEGRKRIEERKEAARRHYAKEEEERTRHGGRKLSVEEQAAEDNDNSVRRRLSISSGHVDHCSALIKLLDDNSDILFGHDTWDDFQMAAPRIFKHYTFNLMQGAKPFKMSNVQFSSSPGMLTSNDDYFVTAGAANIAVMETTIDMFNRTLLGEIVPQSMLSWARSHAANQLAVDGQNWAELFSMYHSGTYVNQWMVMDFDKFIPLTGPQPGFLTVLEEVPSFIHYEDVTEILKTQGYWASYNNPYFADIAELSLNSALCAQNERFCYDTDPRANIFRANQAKVVGVHDMKWLLQYNDFQHDPLSMNNSCWAVACRNDLQPNRTIAYPFGAIDVKISSVMLSNRPVPITITKLGPSNDEQPVFCWAEWDLRRNKRGEKFHHAGHPACFDYDWQTMPPNLNEL